MFVFQASHQCINIIIFVIHFSSCDGDYILIDILFLCIGACYMTNICICVCRNWINSHFCLTTQLCYNPAWIVFCSFWTWLNAVFDCFIWFLVSFNIRAPLEQVLCTLIVPSLALSTILYLCILRRMISKNHRSVRIFVPVNGVPGGPVNGYRGIWGDYRYDSIISSSNRYNISSSNRYIIIHITINILQ